jgi:hypothetical protein
MNPCKVAKIKKCGMGKRRMDAGSQRKEETTRLNN